MKSDCRVLLTIIGTYKLSEDNIENLQKKKKNLVQQLWSVNNLIKNTNYKTASLYKFGYFPFISVYLAKK